MLRKLLACQVSLDAFDRKMGQCLFFAGSAVVLVLAVFKLSSLQLPEGQFFIGLLGALTVSLLMVAIGLLLKPCATRQ